MSNAYAIINQIKTASGDHADAFCRIMQDRFQIIFDKDWTARQCLQHIFHLIYTVSLYDNLTPWYKEYSGDSNDGTYVPLAERRPSVIYPIPKIIVNQSTSMLFSKQHFPTLKCEVEQTAEFFAYMGRHCNLQSAMLTAARKGALGSVCIIVKVLEAKFYFDVISTMYLTPTFDQYNPNKLIKLVERKKVTGESLMEKGHQIPNPKENKKKLFWITREWNENEEIYYEPYLVETSEEAVKLIPNTEISSTHNLGFLPAIWIKNTPEGSELDGHCTFRPIIDMCIEIDYQLSQLGRLLKYNSDPTMVIKDSAGMQGKELIKGAGALELSADGDAYMLEMTGASTKCVLDFVRCMREFALETVRGDRTSPDKLSSVHSGKALQMLNSALISLTDEMRLSYGENGLMRLYEMCLDIIDSGLLEINMNGYMPGDIKKSKGCMTLDWPDWYPPTPMDDLQESQALQTNLTSGVVSKKTGIEAMATKYGVIDTQKEAAEIAQDQKQQVALEVSAKKVDVSNKGTYIPKDTKSESTRNG